MIYFPKEIPDAESDTQNVRNCGSRRTNAGVEFHGT
jgi:hypothetical protein